MKRLKLNALLMILLLISACEDDDNMDVIPPTIELTSHILGEEVYNTVEFNFEASDDVGLSSVAIAINGTQINQLNTPPFQFIVDTRNYDDGENELKAIAKDNSGNQTEIFSTIRINNAFADMLGTWQYNSGTRRIYEDGQLVEENSFDYDHLQMIYIFREDKTGLFERKENNTSNEFVYEVLNDQFLIFTDNNPDGSIVTIRENDIDQVDFVDIAERSESGIVITTEWSSHLFRK